MRLEEQLCFALYAATNAIVRSYRPHLQNIGLTYPQYLVLIVLWQDGERTMGAIADSLSLPPGGITPIVERLEAAGLVTRRRDKADRRVVHIAPTPAGLALETAAAEAQRQVACATMLPPDELAFLRNALHDLSDHLNTTKDGVPAL